MFLDNYSNKSIEKIAKSGGTFTAGYKYWQNILFERAMRLFEWKGPDESGIPQKEIEAALLTGGICGITNKYKKKLAAFNGWYAGSPTVYYDIYEDFAVHSPLYSGVLKIDKDVAVIENNAVRNSLMPLISRYASMLAHVEVTMINVLINGRDKAIPTVMDETQKQAVETYRNALCNGKVTAIQDPAFSTVKFITVDTANLMSIKDLVEVRENLLNAFYSDIGVKTAWNKKGNMISEEVEADSPMLLLNLNDMLASRKKGCENVNKLYGTNWSVDISPELRYNDTEEDDEDGEQSKSKEII